MRNVTFADEKFTPRGPTLKLRQGSVCGPFSFLNPTTALYDIESNDRPGGRRAELADLTDAEKQERAKVRWNARDYRKGRHILILPRHAPLAAKLESSTNLHHILRGIGRMFTMFPYWDVSWLIGICFTIGCLIFVACGVFYWAPIAYPNATFSGESALAGGITCFVGATLFQIGAILLFLESYNDRAETQFGGAVGHIFIDRLRLGRHRSKETRRHYGISQDPMEEELAEDEDHSSTFGEAGFVTPKTLISKPPSPPPAAHLKPEFGSRLEAPKDLPSPIQEKPNDDDEKTAAANNDKEEEAFPKEKQEVPSDSDESADPKLNDLEMNDLETMSNQFTRTQSNEDAVPEDSPFAERQWQWWPSWHDIRHHYIYEIGFLASFTMSLGATVFYICGILALPGIYNNLSLAAIQGAYFFPYLLGGVLFAVSSVFYMLEVQPNWYTPQPYKIGWYVGFFNFWGGIGWTFAAATGYCDPYWCGYQSELALIWASASFSIGSALQWYESLDKYVVVKVD